MKSVNYINDLFSDARDVAKISERHIFVSWYEEDPERANRAFWDFIRDVSTCPSEMLTYVESLIEEARRSKKISEGNGLEPPGYYDRAIPCPACSRS